jgi:hypothetical protein
MEYRGEDDRGNKYWRGRMLRIDEPCTVTAILDGRTSEQMIVTTELCGAPAPRSVYFGGVR